MRSIRWGILGAGGIARVFVSDLLGARDQGADLEVVAVGARSLESARAFADEFGIDTAHGSYEALVADDSVDAIYVATPHIFHRDQALLAIAAGKHVLVEKSFTMNAAEAREVFDAAGAAGVIALEAMWTRFLPQNHELRRILDSRVIGDVLLFEGTHGQRLPADPRHRINDPALGGGALLDLGVYTTSFALDVLGAPTGIRASAVLSDQGVDARISAIFDHEGGAQSLTYSALDLRLNNTGTISGTAGRIDIDPVFFTPEGFTVYDSDGAVVQRYESPSDGLRGMQHQAFELANLVEFGWSGGPDFVPALTPADSIAVMETMDEMRRQVGVSYPTE